MLLTPTASSSACNTVFSPLFNHEQSDNNDLCFFFVVVVAGVLALFISLLRRDPKIVQFYFSPATDSSSAVNCFSIFANRHNTQHQDWQRSRLEEIVRVARFMNQSAAQSSNTAHKKSSSTGVMEVCACVGVLMDAWRTTTRCLSILWADLKLEDMLSFLCAARCAYTCQLLAGCL